MYSHSMFNACAAGVDDNSVNVMPYVFTNPPKAARLYGCDKVFVLSQKELTSAGISTRSEVEKVRDRMSWVEC